MESLKLSFEAVMPIFMLMSLGYFLKKINIVDKKIFDGINKLVFKIFLPVLLFFNIYKTDTLQIFDAKLITFTILAVLIIFGIGYVSVFFLTKDNSKRGVMLQGFFRSNYAILGIPLVNYICKENSTGITSLMVAVVVPVFNILATISLEKFRESDIRFRKLIIGVLKNPLIIGCILGLIFLLLNIKLPYIIEESVKDVSSIASPLAIIALGAGFTFSSIKGYIREVLIVVSVRLIFVPLMMLTLATFFGFRGEALACLLVVFGSPVAVSSFVMAEQMGGDEKLAAQIVVLSSVGCILTLFIWIFMLNSIGLF